MSGIEVASFILGVFPLVISGLENCQKGLKPIRAYLKYKQELVALHAFVQAEYSKFLNSIDLLLQPLVPPTELHYLITKPERINWEAPHLKTSLRRRLGPSEEAFYNALQVVEASLKELKSTLKSKNGLDRLHYCFVGTAKRERTKTRLRNGNNDLQSFVIAAKRLGNARERRSLDALEARIKRRELSELHASLSHDPWQCGCRQHVIHLDICSINNPGVDGENRNAPLEIKISLEIMRSLRPKATSSIPTMAVILKDNTPDLECVEEETASFVNGPSIKSSAASISTSSQPTAASALHMSRPRKKLVKKGVAFALPPSQSSTASPAHLSKGSRRRQKLNSVCSVVPHSTVMRDCVGYLETATKARMHVYALPSHYHRRITSETPSVTLQEALGASAPVEPGRARRSLPPALLRTRTRLELASAMALCYPQLQSTPWAEVGLTKAGISFTGFNRDDAAVDFGTPLLSQSFGPASARMSPSSSTEVSYSGSAMSQALAFVSESKTEGLFALGKLLIELAFNTCLEGLYEDSDKNQGKVFEFTEYLAAKRLLPEIYEEHGYMYGEAVRRCIEGVDVREKAIENPEFRRAFWRDIYQPLQDASEFFSGKPG